MTEIRWHGRGGLGAFTAARLLGCAVSLYEGKYALAFPSFGPERRGAPVFAFTRIDNKPITDRSEVVKYGRSVVLIHAISFSISRIVRMLLSISRKTALSICSLRTMYLSSLRSVSS